MDSYIDPYRRPKKLREYTCYAYVYGYDEWSYASLRALASAVADGSQNVGAKFSVRDGRQYALNALIAFGYRLLRVVHKDGEFESRRFDKRSDRDLYD